MTHLQKAVLNQLAKSMPGKGQMLDGRLKRSASSLIGKGYVFAVNGGFGDIFILTDEGREAWYRMR